MVTRISTKPNTFYVLKDLDDGIGITPTYGDAYEGLTATFNLESNPKTTYLLGESTIITANDYVYGAGDINEMYISTYTNAISQINPQTAPFVDVYNIHPNIDLTEGNMVIISGQTKQICTFSSWYDFAMPWLLEDFDGTEKHLFNVSRTPRKARSMEGYSYSVELSAAINFLVKIVRQNEIEEGASGTDADDSFLGLGIGKAIDSSIDYLMHEGREIKAFLGFQGGFGTSEFGQTGVVSSVIGTRDEGLAATQVPLIKKANGRYKFDITWPEGYTTHGKIKDVAANEDFSLEAMLSIGAYSRMVRHVTVGAYKKSNFGEDYVGKATANNTIFSDIFGNSDQRDMKAMTNEKPGDTPYFLAYGYANLIVGDSYAGEQSLQTKLYWENYSTGSIGLTGEEAQDIANPFGRNASYGTPNTQDKVMSIHGIPQPYSFDLTRPHFSGSAFGPEIEIVFKINKMDVTPHYSGTASTTIANGRALERSFSIIGGATAPTGDENMLGEYADVMGEGQYWISFFNSGNSAGLIDVVGNNLSTDFADGSTATDLGHIYYEDMSNVTGTAYHTQVPKGKWLTARIKFIQRSTGGGYDIMLYFPDELDSNGEMKFIELKNQTAWAPTQWFNHLTFWQNNIRSINYVPTSAMGDNTDHINNGYYADAVKFDDKEVNVIIDSISFYGWGLDVRNSTVAMNTGDSDLLRIPSAYAAPAPTNIDTGSAAPSGPVQISSQNFNNMYGAITVPIATYVSIGYDNPGWTPATYADNPASGSLFTEGHNLLLSDFSTVQAESIRPITLVSGTHFGSNDGGYPGYPHNWFLPDIATATDHTPTTVGTTAADNIRIGGFDNSVDSFTQKGLIGIKGSDAQEGGFGEWKRTSNPYVSARILNVEENGTLITVDNTKIFDMPSDTEYVIEKWPGTQLRQNYTAPYYSLWGGKECMGYQGTGSYIAGTGGRITATLVGNGKVKLSRSVLSTDDGDGAGNASLIEYNVANPDFGLGTYIISPYKYWLVMAMVDVSGSDAGGWGSWWEAGPTPSQARATAVLSGIDQSAIADATTFTLNGVAGYLTPVTYTFDTGTEGDTDSLQIIGIKNDTDADATAQIVSCINRMDTVSGTGIRASVTAASEITLTQSTYGTAGNTTITSVPSEPSFSGMVIPTAFTGGVDPAGVTSFPFIPIQNASVGRMPARAYSNLVAVSGGATEGTTFNERIFNDGIYANRWNISFWDPETSIVNLKTDYGFGAIANDEEATGVASAGGVGFMGHDYLLSGQNYINISNYVGVTQPKEGDDFNFLIKPTFTDTAFARYSINMNTDEATTNKLSVLYGLRDLPPVMENFNVFPVLELSRLKDVSATLQAGDANVRFTWTEQDDDVWYRLLFVDNKNIRNKYHNINFWAPLNETGSSDTAIPDYGFYTSQTDTTPTSFTNSGSVISNIEGFTGYGAKFDGTDDYLIGASHTFASAASKWSFIVHCKPSAASGGIFDVWSTTSKFKIEISSNRIKVTEAGSSKTLTSVNSYDADGFQPLAIVVTFDKDVNDNNWKLIVNGKLEDTEDYTSAISIAGTVFIGASGTGDATTGANFFTGFIEEITSYEETTVYIPPNENNYLLNTSGYPDLTTGATANTSLYYTGRLFVMDYHNIRGKGPRNIGRTDMASWKVTGI